MNSPIEPNASKSRRSAALWACCRWLFFFALCAISIVADVQAQPAPKPLADHLVIIGIDGLGSFGLNDPKIPNIDQLRHEGAGTLHTRGVMPTSSSPNWASMIMGAGPEQHGVTSNDWQPEMFEIPPTAAHILGLQAPTAWIGKVVLEAFYRTTAGSAKP